MARIPRLLPVLLLFPIVLLSVRREYSTSLLLLKRSKQERPRAPTTTIANGSRTAAAAAAATAVAAASNNKTTTTKKLPDALQPVTFDGCCGEDEFVETCFTETACNSSIYPFSSLQQADKYRRWKPPDGYARRCHEEYNNNTPPMNWCDDSKNFMMGCSQFTQGGGSGPFDRFFFLPEAKLAFCGIPKVGITQWTQFFRFVGGAKDYQSFPYFKKDVDKFRVDLLPPSLQQEIWSSWTKAVFIREPAERLLSAYLDKIETNGRKPFGQENVTFAEFVEFVGMKNVTFRNGTWTGLSWLTDPHWRPQAWSCGLSEWLVHFDYVGTLDEDRVAFHTKTLLQQVGLWESHGQYYRITRDWRKEDNHPSLKPPSPSKDEPSGFQQETAMRRVQAHGTDSHAKLKEYYTPELRQKVRKLYWMDYALWDALQQGDVNGKEIAKRLNPTACAK